MKTVTGPGKGLQRSPGRFQLPVVLKTELQLPDHQSSRWHMNLHAYPDPEEDKGQYEGQGWAGKVLVCDCQSALSNPPMDAA